MEELYPIAVNCIGNICISVLRMSVNEMLCYGNRRGRIYVLELQRTKMKMDIMKTKRQGR